MARTGSASRAPHATTPLSHAQSAGVSRVRLVTDLPDDAVLVARIRSADEAAARNAFSLLYMAYGVPLGEWAYYLTRNRTVAEEAVADVLAGLWHRRRTWSPGANIEAYLFGAVRMQIREETRTADRRVALTQAFVRAGESPAMSTPFAATDAATQADEDRARLERAMAGLTGRARAAVMYRWYEGLEYDEIAIRLGTSEGAVRVLVTRALKVLRAHLSPG